MKNLSYFALLATTAAIAPQASAQSSVGAGDVIVMRRVVSPPMRQPAPTPTPTPTATPTPAPTPTPSPAPSYTGHWVSDPPVADAPACSATSAATVAVRCTINGTDDAGPSKCDPALKPSTVSTVADYRACTSEWKTSAWSTDTSGVTCGPYVQSRDIWCERSDGAQSGAYSGAHACNMGEIPDRQQNAFVDAGCTYRWDYGNYGAWSSTCGSNATRTRPVNGCLREQTATYEADQTKCTATRVTSETADNFSGCTYTATYGAWGACLGGTQSAPATTCTRSDGTPFPTDKCGPTTRTCTTSACDALQGGGETTSKWVTGASGVQDLGKANSLTEALTKCNAAANGISFNGFCTWNNNSNLHGTVYLWTGGSIYSVSGGNGSGTNLYASACRPS